ncbi:unnamed protein product, partial [Brassica rapa subsp. trilocularis]
RLAGERERERLSAPPKRDGSVYFMWEGKLETILWRKKDFSVFEKEENKDYSVTSSSSTIQVLVSDLLDTSELTIFTFNSVASANRKISLKKTSLDRANLVLCIR